MHTPKRVAAALAAAAVLAAAAPSVAGAAVPSAVGPGLTPSSDLCLPGIVDPGPFGPLGPYGPYGPYGKDGPLHDSPNPIGDAATCGGLMTFILRGGTLPGFVQGSVTP